MSKRLPYYQSEPAEYLAGDIMFCSFGSQGVFSILRALYWQKDCELKLSQAKRRILNADEYFTELINEGIIKVNNDFISISFLDEQFNKATKKSSTNSENGKKGAIARWRNNGESIATPLKKDGECMALREDKIKEDKIKEETDESEIVVIELYPTFDDFWELYDKKVGKDKTLKKWNVLKQKDKEEILNYIPNYKASKTEKQYLQNPLTFLNSKTWNDEIIIKTKDIKDDKQRRIDELANRITQGKPKTLNIEINSSYE